MTLERNLDFLVKGGQSAEFLARTRSAFWLLGFSLVPSHVLRTPEQTQIVFPPHPEKDSRQLQIDFDHSQDSPSNFPFNVIPEADISLYNRTAVTSYKEQPLIDIVTREFHARRPRIKEIKGQLIDENQFYSPEIAAKALGIYISSINLLHTPSQGEKIYREKVDGKPLYSGYEILRLSSRPDGRERVEKSKLMASLGISEEMYDLLVKDGVIVPIQSKGKTLISPTYSTSLFDKIFPKKNTPRYAEILRYIQNEGATKMDGPITCEEGASTPIPSTNPRIVTVVLRGESVQREVKFSDSFVFPKDERYNIHKKNITGVVEGDDYVAIPHFPNQTRDVFYVRAAANGNAHGNAHDAFVLGDITRLLLVRNYLTREITEKYLEKEGYPWDEKDAIRFLEKSGMFPMTYNGQLLFPPGTTDIVIMPFKEVEILGKLAIPLIKYHGPFVTSKTIKDLTGQGFGLQTLNDKKKSGKIAHTLLGTESVYNLFQVVREFKSSF